MPAWWGLCKVYIYIYIYIWQNLLLYICVVMCVSLCTQSYCQTKRHLHWYTFFFPFAEKERELGVAHGEIKSLKATEALKDKAVEEVLKETSASRLT